MTGPWRSSRLYGESEEGRRAARLCEHPGEEPGQSYLRASAAAFHGAGRLRRVPDDQQRGVRVDAPVGGLLWELCAFLYARACRRLPGRRSGCAASERHVPARVSHGRGVVPGRLRRDGPERACVVLRRPDRERDRSGPRAADGHGREHRGDDAVHSVRLVHRGARAVRVPAVQAVVHRVGPAVPRRPAPLARHGSGRRGVRPADHLGRTSRMEHRVRHAQARHAVLVPWPGMVAVQSGRGVQLLDLPEPDLRSGQQQRAQLPAGRDGEFHRGCGVRHRGADQEHLLLHVHDHVERVHPPDQPHRRRNGRQHGPDPADDARGTLSDGHLLVPVRRVHRARTVLREAVGRRGEL